MLQGTACDWNCHLSLHWYLCHTDFSSQGEWHHYSKGFSTCNYKHWSRVLTVIPKGLALLCMWWGCNSRAREWSRLGIDATWNKISRDAAEQQCKIKRSTRQKNALNPKLCVPGKRVVAVRHSNSTASCSDDGLTLWRRCWLPICFFVLTDHRVYFSFFSHSPALCLNLCVCWGHWHYEQELQTLNFGSH